MTKFYVITREVVEKTITIEVDTDSKLEARKAYVGPEGTSESSQKRRPIGSTQKLGGFTPKRSIAENKRKTLS